MRGKWELKPALCIKTIRKAKHQQTIPLHYVKLHAIVQKYKSQIGSPHRRQVVHLRPQTPQGGSVAKPETHLLIVLNLVCKCDIKEVHGNYSYPVFSKKVHGQKHPWEVDTCKKSSLYFILSKYWQHPVQDNQCRKGQATTGHPS